MPLTKSATDGLLRAVAWLHPEYGGLIDFLEAHEDQLQAAGPVIQAAAAEGPGALEAAEKAAPDLARAIKDFAGAIGSGDPADSKVHAENITRHLVGAPALTPEQTQAWLNPISEDSRSGSG
jgi:hypothetical protein